jgi:hypothetical protein
MIPEWVLQIISEWINKHLTGSLTINFFRGGVTSIKKEETVKN